MPYSSDKRPLPDEIFDKRIRLLHCQIEQIKNVVARGMSLRAIAKMYHVSHKTIWNKVNPGKYEKELEQNRNNKKSAKYYDKKKACQAVIKSRRKKREIVNLFLNT